MQPRRPFVFVLMPFEREFEDVYRLGIKVACERAGATAERVDDQMFQESILDRIYGQIRTADIIVADMSGRKPNVFYETGYAHALNKPVILLTNNAEDIPFDLKHYPHIIYGGRIVDLLQPLQDRVGAVIAAGVGANAPTSMSMASSGFAERVSLPSMRTSARKKQVASRQDIIVDSTGDGDYELIADAIDAAHDGDRIVVNPGVYYERLDIHVAVELVGNEQLGQVLVEEKTGPILTLGTPFAAVRNLRLCNLGKKDYPAVAVAVGRPVLENCDISSLGGHCVSIAGASRFYGETAFIMAERAESPYSDKPNP